MEHGRSAAAGADRDDPPPSPLKRAVVLVGLMGAGKSSVGRKLAKTLHTHFHDADDEIAAAAGMSIPDIFIQYGEAEFRELERRVVARLVEALPGVLALGGGAFIDPQTRKLVKERATCVWLRADLDTLVARTSRKRGTRPLLAAGDPRAILEQLMEARHPIYAEADITVDTGEHPAEVVVERITELLGLSAGVSASGGQ